MYDYSVWLVKGFLQDIKQDIQGLSELFRFPKKQVKVGSTVDLLVKPKLLCLKESFPFTVDLQKVDELCVDHPGNCPHEK